MDLDELALRATGEGLRPFMRDDETIVDYDIYEAELLGVRVLSSETGVVLSTRALYLLYSGTDAVRIPYADIVNMDAVPGRIVFTTASGNAYGLLMRGRPRANLYSQIVDMTSQLVLHQDKIPVPGGEVFAVLRPVGEDNPPTWLIFVSEGIDQLDDAQKEQMDRVVRERLAPAEARHGVDLPEDLFA